MLVTYAILRLQAMLPLQHLFNPQASSALKDHPRLRYGSQLHDEHQLAKLWR